ncbi:MAG: START domain-containing protein [Chlorobi bacterium]|nr:START domain-containing protein [Chlorobiota bacterium]
MFTKLLLGLLIVATNAFASATSDWELKKDEDGIKVYVRSVDGSSFKEYKGVTTIKNVSLNDVLDVIFDVENYDKLFPDVSGQKMINNIDKYHNIHYVVVHTPWPVADRDNVTELEAKIAEDGKSADISIKTRPELVEVKKGLVRIPEGKGHWKLTVNPDNSVTVVYQYHGNPGGSIPSWLANSFVVSHPFETLENLHKRLEQ